MKIAHRLGFLALVIFIPVAVGLTAVRSYNDHRPAEDPITGDCEGADLRGASVRMKVSLNDGGRDYPRLATFLHVEIPVSQPLAIDLEESRDSVAFKSAVQCLLYNNGHYNDELRDRDPRIIEDGSNVVFEDSEHIDVTGPSPVNLGLASLTSTSGRDWLLQISPAPVLSSVCGAEFAFETPDGTAHDAVPWPPAKITDTQIIWSFRNHDAPAAYSVGVRKSFRDSSALSAGNGGAANIVATCLYWLDTAFAPVLLLAFLVYLSRKGRLPDKDGEPLRFIVPSCLLCAMTAVYALLQSALPTAFPWTIFYIVAAVVTVTVAGVSAWIWRVRRLAIVALLLVAYVSIAIVIAVWTLHFLDNDDAAFQKTLIGAWVAYLCAFSALIILGVFESVRRLSAPSSGNRSLIITISALLIAAVMTIERVALDLWYYHQQEWLATAPGWSTRLPADLPSACYVMLSQLSWFVLAVPAICLWSIQSRLGEPSADKPVVRAIGGAILVYSVLNWSIGVSGWSIPLAIPSAIGVWLVLRRSRYLSARATGEKTIADMVRDRSVNQLRQDVTVWQIERQGRLVRERAMTSTTDAIAGFRTWAEHLGTAPSDRVQAASGPSFRDVLRRITGQPSPPTPRQSMDSVTPMDILLAVGPSKSPAENSAQALRLSIVVAVPAAAFMTWLWMRYSGPQLPSMTDNAICNTASNYVWTLLQYTFGGTAVGLLWHYLPGQRGIVKVLPVAGLYAAVPVLKFSIPTFFGGHVGIALLADALVFFLILMYVGISMDAVSLRGPSQIWTAPGRILLSAYGMQNFATQLTFVAANVGAVIAIWNLLHGNGEGGVAHDPSVLNKTPGGGSR